MQCHGQEYLLGWIMWHLRMLIRESKHSHNWINMSQSAEYRSVEVSPTATNSGSTALVDLLNYACVQLCSNYLLGKGYTGIRLVKKTVIARIVHIDQEHGHKSPLLKERGGIFSCCTYCMLCVQQSLFACTHAQSSIATRRILPQSIFVTST